ncbi:MAG: hypothetical protein AABW45_01490 [Nanoarchaeota archaeon]|mgnify:FL=1
MKKAKPKSLEDLIPKVLTKNHLEALQELEKHQKEYKKVNSEVNENLENETWLNLVFYKVRINPKNYNIADRYRLMYGIILQKNYSFIKKH